MLHNLFPFDGAAVFSSPQPAEPPPKEKSDLETIKNFVKIIEEVGLISSLNNLELQEKVEKDEGEIKNNESKIEKKQKKIKQLSHENLKIPLFGFVIKLFFKFLNFKDLKIQNNKLVLLQKTNQKIKKELQLPQLILEKGKTKVQPFNAERVKEFFEGKEKLDKKLEESSSDKKNYQDLYDSIILPLVKKSNPLVTKDPGHLGFIPTEEYEQYKVVEFLYNLKKNDETQTLSKRSFQTLMQDYLSGELKIDQSIHFKLKGKMIQKSLEELPELKKALDCQWRTRKF